MDPNEQILQAIRERTEKRTEFNYGILPADRYVKTLQECVGSDLCYRYAAKGSTSFDDTLKRASKTLTYCNPEMELEEKLNTNYRPVNDSEFTMPKNTLMVFKHRLTTPKKDRDGDILRTEGAKPDPKMPLLWQHVHTLPIGKMLVVAEHTSKVLSLVSCIIDMNDLCHDAAVMIDNDMGRFSHGFRALNFTSMKEEEGNTTGKPGFDIKEFEIMEESVVSVPANTDADVQEVMLSLIDGGKMTSGLMKAYGKHIKTIRPAHSHAKSEGGVHYTEVVGDYAKTIEAPNAADFEKVFDTLKKGEIDADESGDSTGSEKGACGCGGSSKEADADGDKTGETQVPEVKSYSGKTGAANDHVHAVTLDDDGNGTAAAANGHTHKIEAFKVAAAAGHTHSLSKDQLTEKELEEVIEKAGRMFSRENVKMLKEVHEDLKELGKESNLSRGGGAICERCMGKLSQVIKKADGSYGAVDETEDDHGHGKDENEITTKDAMALFLAESSSTEKQLMLDTLEAMKASLERAVRTKSVQTALLGSK